MLVLAVVDSHREHHGEDSAGRPAQLPQEKKVTGTVALFCHHRGSAENHYQPYEDQEQRNRKQPAIDTDALRHGEDFISPRRHGVRRPFSDNFSGGFNSFGSPAPLTLLRLL